MIEKAVGILRRIERNVLVQAAGAEAALRQAGRGDRAGGQKEAQVRACGAQRVDHGQHAVCLANTRSVDPREHAFGARGARPAEALAAAARVFLAAALAQLEDQRCHWPQQAHAGAVGLEAQIGLCRRCIWVIEAQRGDALHVAAGQRVGARGHGVERAVELGTCGLERGLIGIGRHADRLADHVGELGEWQVDGHPAPGAQRKKARGRRGDRNDRTAGEARERHDAGAGTPSRARRDVGGHDDRIAVLESPHSLAQGMHAAAVLAPHAGAGAADQLHAEVRHCSTDELGIAVAGDHGRNLDALGRPEARRHHELAVPGRDDDRMHGL